MPLEIERKLLVIEDGWRPQEPGTRLLEYAYPVPLQHAQTRPSGRAQGRLWCLLHHQFYRSRGRRAVETRRMAQGERLGKAHRACTPVGDPGPVNRLVDR